ncbi:MAG: heavy metal-responsive transcriptional regulator [Gammaproteobacteria bacterium]|nr:heavy metal-responsive transcriptional regulator [Gammaproteobacteria bacterium]
MSRLSIGQVAKQAGVTVEALRFYEKQGLLTPAERTAAGYRYYEAEVVRRVRFIQRAKALGFALKQVAELLNLRQSRQTSCAEVKRVAQGKMADIDQKLADLQQMRAGLARLAARCDLDGALGECPLLDALDQLHANEALG